MNKINKYASGGVYVAPYVVYTPTPYTSSSSGAAPAAASKEKSEDLTNKDMMEMLNKLDGLPADMQGIYSRLRRFIITQSYDTGELDTSQIALNYANILYRMKLANFSKKEYDKAYKHAEAINSIQELAVTDRGQFVCSNGEGDFKLMTPEELKESDNKYRPLTNSELLYYRSHDISMAGQNSIFSVVQAGTSMNEINRMIKEVADRLGTQEVDDAGVSYAPRAVRGYREFINAQQKMAALGQEGTISNYFDLYKYKIVNRSQMDNIQAAMAYIYSTLPESAKALLKVKSGKFTDEGAQELISAQLMAKAENKFSFDLTPISERESENGSRKSGNSDKEPKSELKMGHNTQILEGFGGSDTVLTIDPGYDPNNPSSIRSSSITVYGTVYNNLYSQNGNSLIGDYMSMSRMLQETGLAAIVDYSNMQFGDQSIDQDQLRKIGYLGGGAVRAILPIKADGQIDFDKIDEFRKAMVEIEEKGLELGDNDTEEQKQNKIEKQKEIYKKYNLNSYLNDNGEVDPTKAKPFLIFSGLASKQETEIEDSKYVEIYSSREDVKKFEKEYEKCMTNGGAGPKNKNDNKFDAIGYGRLNWFNKQHFYKGCLYIPLNMNELAAATSEKQKLSWPTGADLQRRYQDKDKWFNLGDSSADLLDEEE